MSFNLYSKQKQTEDSDFDESVDDQQSIKLVTARRSKDARRRNGQDDSPAAEDDWQPLPSTSKTNFGGLDGIYHPFKHSIEESAFRVIDMVKPESSWTENKPSSLTPGPKVLNSSLEKGKRTEKSTLSGSPKSPSAFQIQSGESDEKVWRHFSRTPGLSSRTPDVVDNVVSHLFSQSPLPDKVPRLALPLQCEESPSEAVRHERFVSSLIQNDTPIALKERVPNSAYGIPKFSLSPRSSLSSAHEQPYFMPTSDLSYDAAPWDMPTKVADRRDVNPLSTSQVLSDAISRIDKNRPMKGDALLPSHSISPPRSQRRDESLFHIESQLQSRQIDKPKSSLDAIPLRPQPPNQMTKGSTGSNFTYSHDSTSRQYNEISSDPVLLRPKLSQERPYGSTSERIRKFANGKDDRTLVSSSLESDSSFSANSATRRPSWQSTQNVHHLSNEVRSSFDSYKNGASKVPVYRVPISVHPGPQDFVETPRTKAHFREFQAFLRSRLKENEFVDSEALAKIEEIPEHSRWRCYIELAELSKKYNEYDKV